MLRCSGMPHPTTVSSDAADVRRGGLLQYGVAKVLHPFWTMLQDTGLKRRDYSVPGAAVSERLV